MKRRNFLTLAASGLMVSALSLPGVAGERVFYAPGIAESAMQAGKVVFLDFWTNWCSTCAAQDRVIADLRANNPAYDANIVFITVDWDKYADSEISRTLYIPRRSTLVALKGQTELGRIVAGTSHEDIQALMDLALGAATS